MPTHKTIHKQAPKNSKTRRWFSTIVRVFIVFIFILFFTASIFLAGIFYISANLENIIHENYPDITAEFNTYIDSQMDNNPDHIKAFLKHQPCPQIRTYLPNSAYNTIWRDFNKTTLTTKHPILADILDQMDPYIFYNTFENTAQQKAIFKFNNKLYILTTNNDMLKDIDQDLVYAITSCYLGTEKASKPYNINLMNQQDFQKAIYEHEQNFQHDEDKYLQENRNYIKYAQEQIIYLENIKKRYGNYSWIESQKKKLQQNIQKAEQNIAIIKQNTKISQKKIEHMKKLKGLAIYQGDIYINLDSNQDTNCFLFTLMHETLHRLSNRKDYQLPSVWEEGLTDILAQKMLEQTLEQTIINKRLCSGYNKIDTIEELLFKNVNKQDLIDIYFSKDINKIRMVIDKEFGKGTFDKISPELQKIYEESWEGIVTEQEVKDVIEEFGLGKL